MKTPKFNQPKSKSSNTADYTMNKSKNGNSIAANGNDEENPDVENVVKHKILER